MPFSFPSSPTVGQTSTQNGRSYTYAGNNVWELTPATGGGSDSRWHLFLPPAPTSLVATAGNAQVALSWTAPTGVIAQAPINDYTVQVSSNSGTTWTTFSDGTSTATGATVTGLSNGTAYTFRVAAVNGVGTGAYSTASSAVTPAAGDAYFSQVSLLMHFNGANGSTTLTDSSSNAFSVTRNGSPQISTAESKFGGSSLLLNGSSDIVLPAASAFNFGTDNFTIELWVRFASLSGGQRIGGGDRQGGGSYNWAIYKANGSSTLTFLAGDGSSPWSMGNTGFGTVTVNQWHHVAIVRNGNTFTGYIDGVAGGSFSSSGSIVSNSTNGAFFGYATGDYFNGYVDEIRITKGANGARYTANFTPPTAAFPDS